MRIGMNVAAWVLAGLIFADVARAADEPAKRDDAAAPAKAQSIDFRKLKEWMPTELNGLKRTECNGERNKINDMSITQCSATFKKEDKEGAPEIQVQIIDYSNAEFAKGLSAAWTAVEIDKESDDGFEKTLKVKGQPAMLRWQKENKHGEVQVLVGSRYIVTVTTENLPAEQVSKVAEGLALDKLADLK